MNSKTAAILIGVAVVIVITVAAAFQFTKTNSEPSMTTPSQSDSQSQLTPPVSDTAKPVEQQPPVQPPVSEQPATPTQNQAAFDPAKKYTATLKTEKGDIVVEFTSKQTPKTVENFVTLARKGFYDGTIFHRAIKGFMIQGGDPKGDGTGGPGYKFNDEPFTGEYTRGTIAMANSGPNTNGSQFFIMHQDYALPKNYVIFGHVLSGMDAVDAIATAPVTMSPTGEQSKPVTPVKILSVSISEQ